MEPGCLKGRCMGCGDVIRDAREPRSLGMEIVCVPCFRASIADWGMDERTMTTVEDYVYAEQHAIELGNERNPGWSRRLDGWGIERGWT